MAAHGGQHGIGFFALDDFFEVFLGERLDVGPVRQFRIGHDGGRVGIHQHHFVAFIAQGFAGLRARVIELARLPNDDRPGADDQNLVNVGSLWH